MDREVLPIPDRRYAGLTPYDAKDPGASFPPIEPVRPPAGAPNVLIVLLDDVGFGASSAFVDGEQVGEGAVAATAAMIYSADDTRDVGKEGGALVADDYPVPNDFSGEIRWVEIDVDEEAEDADHVLAPDELLRIAVARQ